MPRLRCIMKSRALNFCHTCSFNLGIKYLLNTIFNLELFLNSSTNFWRKCKIKFCVNFYELYACEILHLKILCCSNHVYFIFRLIFKQIRIISAYKLKNFVILANEYCCYGFKVSLTFAGISQFCVSEMKANKKLAEFSSVVWLVFFTLSVLSVISNWKCFQLCKGFS